MSSNSNKRIVKRSIIIVTASVLVAAAAVVAVLIAFLVMGSNSSTDTSSTSSEVTSSAVSSSTATAVTSIPPTSSKAAGGTTNKKNSSNTSSAKTASNSKTTSSKSTSSKSANTSSGSTSSNSAKKAQAKTYNPIDKKVIQDVKNGKYKGMVAITFDDGPNSETTPKLLNALQKEGMVATFFMLGQNVEGNEAIVKKMVNIGCEIGSHSYSHKDLNTLSANGIQKEVNSSKIAIRKACGYYPTVFRAPYGSVPDELGSILDVPSILWNVDTNDWKYKDAERLEEYLLDNVDDGDIILMHDIHETTVDGFINAIKALKKKGYAFVTVSTLLNRNGVAPVAGQNYYECYPAN